MTITAVDGKSCFLRGTYRLYNNMEDRQKIQRLQELKEIITQTKMMRMHQRDYFRTRNPMYIAVAKKLEVIVDKLITEYQERWETIDDTTADLNQPELF